MVTVPEDAKFLPGLILELILLGVSTLMLKVGLMSGLTDHALLKTFVRP